MSEYTTTVRWTRGEDEFAGLRYSRLHHWRFDGGFSVRASASPQVVRAPWSEEKAVDPEEAFVAALSSCHMLFFLAYASQDGLIVETYEDAATGTMGRNDAGKEVMVRVALHPAVTFRGLAPSEKQYAALHHRAHEECYLANSVRSEIVVEPTQALITG